MHAASYPNNQALQAGLIFFLSASHGFNLFSLNFNGSRPLTFLLHFTIYLIQNINSDQ
jgi:hypothetical protein